MRRNSLPALLALVAPLLAGCIAEYRTYAEDRFTTATDLAEPCRYRWSAEKSLYRAADRNDYAWGDAHKRGHRGLLPYLKQLTSQCATSPQRDAPQARIAAHTLEYVNKQNRNAITAPAAYLNVVALGYVPLEMVNYFAVCVEASFPDGQRRAAVSEGSLEARANTWGTIESPLYPGATLRRENKEQLLLHLTQQAWNKLWIPGQTLAEGSSCRATLDRLAK
jgi:hypothetical protein